MSLRHTILALLEANDSTGYDLAKQFQGSAGHMWSASHQQIYQELAKLNNDGCVNFEEIPQRGKPGRKVYSLTDKGRLELVDWINQPLNGTKIRDELMVRLLASHLVPVDVIRSHINDARVKREETLNSYLNYEKLLETQKKPNDIQQALAQYTLQWGIRTMESWLGWSEEVLNYLDRQQAEVLNVSDH